MGIKLYFHITKEGICGKFNDRAEIGYFVGYDSGNSHRIYFPSKNRVVVSRDVKLHEIFGLSAAENGTQVDLLELDEIEHELDTMLDSPNLPGEEPTG